MIRKDVSFLIDIEDACNSVRLNLETISLANEMISTDLNTARLGLHIAYLCEQDAESSLAKMKQAIDALKQVMQSAPGQEVESEGAGQ